MDDGLEGFGVGGAAEDDKAGQPVAVGVLGGGDEPGQPYPHPGQRLAGVADRAGDELGHRHRDRAPDRGGQRRVLVIAATWDHRPARHRVGAERGRLDEQHHQHRHQQQPTDPGRVLVAAGPCAGPGVCWPRRPTGGSSPSSPTITPLASR